MKRQEVLAEINKERDYQINKWGSTHDKDGGLGNLLLTIECLLNDAKVSIGKGSYDLPALTALRKIAAVSVATLEVYGCPPRN